MIHHFVAIIEMMTIISEDAVDVENCQWLKWWKTHWGANEEMLLAVGRDNFWQKLQGPALQLSPKHGDDEGDGDGDEEDGVDHDNDDDDNPR